MQKTDRQKAIIAILDGYEIGRQDELAELLRKKGHVVTQASISRDLEELGIAKRNGVYIRSIVKDGRNIFGSVSIVEAGESLVVAKCSSGLASAAAVLIDGTEIDGIAGTIAGDDTIFVALGDSKRRGAVVEALRELLGGE